MNRSCLRQSVFLHCHPRIATASGAFWFGVFLVLHVSRLWQVPVTASTAIPQSSAFWTQPHSGYRDSVIYPSRASMSNKNKLKYGKRHKHKSQELHRNFQEYRDRVQTLEDCLAITKSLESLVLKVKAYHELAYRCFSVYALTGDLTIYLCCSSANEKNESQPWHPLQPIPPPDNLNWDDFEMKLFNNALSTYGLSCRKKRGVLSRSGVEGGNRTKKTYADGPCRSRFSHRDASSARVTLKLLPPSSLSDSKTDHVHNSEGEEKDTV
ncbi:hypothetical protein ACA910_006767 [Epithemia clementina (nom. ined.)]